MEQIYSDAGCLVERRERTLLDVWGPWTVRHASLAREFAVEEIRLGSQAFKERQSADFLLEFPGLRGIDVTVLPPIDLSALGRLSRLTSLSVSFVGWRTCDQLAAVDLSGLSELRQADVMLCAALGSVLKCRSIEGLSINNESEGRLKDVDLSLMGRLRSLTLDHCPKLRKVTFHPKAKVRELDVSLCGAYRIDWERMGRDLRRLTLGARLSFPLEEILGAPGLEELLVLEVRKLPGLGFLREMKKLRAVVFFSAPPGPDISEEDGERDQCEGEIEEAEGGGLTRYRMGRIEKAAIGKLRRAAVAARGARFVLNQKE